MKYEHLVEENIPEARMVWRKSGNKIVPCCEMYCW